MQVPAWLGCTDIVFMIYGERTVDVDNERIFVRLYTEYGHVLLCVQASTPTKLV